VSVSISLGPGRSRYRVLQDPRDVDRLRLHFAPSLGRRLVGLGVGALASLGLLAGVRGETGALVAALALASVAALVAFGRTTLVLDRRRERIERLWGAPLSFARLLEARGPFGPVVLTQVEEERERNDQTIRETTYPVSIHGAQGKTTLRALPTWEAGRGFAEAVARFLGVGLEDEVQQRKAPPDGLDEPLAGTAPAGAGSKRRAWPSPEMRWNGEDELVVEIPRPGRPMARRFLGLLAIVGLFWAPLALCGGAVIEALLPLVLIAAAGLKLSWGYGATVVANARGLTVDSRGLVLRRRHHIPLVELESLLLLRPEWGGARGLLAEFFEGVLVARSDRVSVRFGHGLTRADLKSIREQLTQLFARLGHTQSLAAPRSEAPPTPEPVVPVLATWFLCGVGGVWLGPPASFCFSLPILSVWLNALGVSGALLARWLTRRSAPSARGPAGLVALAGALWLGLDVFPGWLAATPDWDTSAFWSAVERSPEPAAHEPWLAGLTAPQAVTFWLGALGVALALAWALALVIVPLWAILTRIRKKPVTLLPLWSPRGGVPPTAAPAPAAWQRQRAPVVLASLALVWSAALGPDLWTPLRRGLEERRARQAAEEAQRLQERRRREATTRNLLRLELPPPGALPRGRPALWYFADYRGSSAALVEHLMWLRRAYAHRDLDVVGFPADVHGAALAALLEERGWHGDHAADAGAAAAYRAWAGFTPGGAFALLLNADGTPRDRLALPWDTERRLADWLGPPTIARPARTPVPILLRWSYAGHPVDLPLQGSMSVLAYDAWHFSNASWYSRRGALPREALPLTVESGTWQVQIRVSALSGERWTHAFDGHARVLLPGTEPQPREVEIPLQVALHIVTPAPDASGLPERPAYPATRPLVIGWSAAPEADRYSVTLTRLDAPESGEPHREELPGERTSLTLTGLPPESYELTVEARRGDVRLGVVETRQGGAWRPAFRFELVR
jgi:hypothetical protein